MNEWFWYIARPDELFIDLDHPVGGPLRRLRHCQSRLRGAIDLGLPIKNHWIYQSDTPWHYHAHVHLSVALEPIARLMWECRFADDSYRHLMGMARLVKCGSPWSLLISPCYRKDYWRGPDYACRCPGKHKGQVMAECPVARKLGPSVTLSQDHFGRPVYTDDPIVLGRQVYRPFRT